MILTIIVVGMGLTTGNFLFQAVTMRQWDVAFERSLFQLVALAACAIALKY